MLINTILRDALQAQGMPLRLLPERDLADYSWPELMAIHPQAQQTLAGILGYGYCASSQELEAAYTPSLGPLAEESDYDYDKRLNNYLEGGYFPAQHNGLLEAGTPSIMVWICVNPFIEELDAQSHDMFVLAPPELINILLRGSRSELATIAPFSEDETIEQWTNRLIAAAYNAGAADVEISSHVSALKVRFKIMGEWGDWVCSIPLTQRGALLRSICAGSNPSLDYEAGADHDFKIDKRIMGVDTSWRGNITPAALGDAMTLRMLPGIGRVPTLDELGYSAHAIQLLRKAKTRKDGLVLVTGSTGHGKTTTLYSLITEMRDENRKVFTVEHPVELVIPGTTQKSVLDNSNIDAKYRVTFTSAIRTALRHAPDVLVVGETRDPDTAQTAVSASRTGHLTYTTLHTTNVRTSIKRMLDLGIDAANLADTVTLVVSQNLVRTLCIHCRIEHDDGTSSPKPGGCPQCSGRGFKGRTVVYEMAYLDEEAREAVIDGDLDKHFDRLGKLGLYIAKHDVAEKLWKKGIVAHHDIQEFLRA